MCQGFPRWTEATDHIYRCYSAQVSSNYSNGGLVPLSTTFHGSYLQDTPAGWQQPCVPSKDRSIASNYHSHYPHVSLLSHVTMTLKSNNTLQWQVTDSHAGVTGNFSLPSHLRLSPGCTIMSHNDPYRYGFSVNPPLDNKYISCILMYVRSRMEMVYVYIVKICCVFVNCVVGVTDFPVISYPFASCLFFLL